MSNIFTSVASLGGKLVDDRGDTLAGHTARRPEIHQDGHR
jgi:hypothetical protein